MPSYSTSRPMWTRGKGPRSGSCRDCWRKKHRRRDDEPIGRRFFSYGGGGTLFLYLYEPSRGTGARRSEEHTSELQSRLHLVCRLLLEKKNNNVSPSSIVLI